MISELMPLKKWMHAFTAFGGHEKIDKDMLILAKKYLHAFGFQQVIVKQM
jgi:hypothetical protein